MGTCSVGKKASIAFLTYLRENNYLGKSGKDYDKYEVDRLYFKRVTDKADKEFKKYNYEKMLQERINLKNNNIKYCNGCKKYKKISSNKKESEFSIRPEHRNKIVFRARCKRCRADYTHLVTNIPF